MKGKLFGASVLVLTIVIPGGAASGDRSLTLRFSDPLVVGRGERFHSITSVTEDEKGCIYVLDRMEHRVVKFAPDGKRLFSFGQKGQGPGDFLYPHLLECFQGKIVVCDERTFVSFFTPGGRFLSRVRLDGRLAPALISEDRFYAWVWEPGGRMQVVVDGENRILKTLFRAARDTFSVSVPDATGRQVMFSYSHDAFTPSLEFSHQGGISAVAVSDRYEILLLDGEGDTLSRLERPLKPQPLSRKERRFVEDDIRDLARRKGWPGKIFEKLTAIIPRKKAFFSRVQVTPRWIFVLRVREDISDENQAAPVDVFSPDGTFLGTAFVESIPILTTDKAMYFVRLGKEGLPYLERVAYRLEESSPEKGKVPQGSFSGCTRSSGRPIPLRSR